MLASLSTASLAILASLGFISAGILLLLVCAKLSASEASVLGGRAVATCIRKTRIISSQHYHP